LLNCGDRPQRLTETQGTTVNTQTLTYQPYSGAVSTTYNATHKWLPSVSVVQSADDLGRPKGFATKVSTTTLATQAYQYDALSRLEKVSSADLTAEIGYLDGTGTLRQQTIKAGTQTVHHRRLAIDMLGRTEGMENRVPVSGLGSGPGSALTSIASVGHSYDLAGRRQNANREDGSVWDYTYNDRSEVETANKKTESGTTVPGLGFTYNYDGIGNRTTASIGSDSHTTSLSYSPNALNQYANPTHTGNFWALVRSDAPVTATATTTPPVPAGASIVGITQVGNFYGAKITATNSTAGKFITNSFLRSADPVAGSIGTWVPAASFNPIYDLDGNLTDDGRWVSIWDGESRLVSMIPNATALSNGAPNVEVYFAYDYASRRIGKTVVDKRVTPSVSKHISYAYDQWNPVAVWERTSFSVPLILKHTHLWGLDIGSSGSVETGSSASFQQAGGVGGLIASTFHNSPSSRESFIPSYDANGNIIAWTAGSNGSLLRKIDYDAFGNEVVVENFGIATQTAKLPEFSFSTKIKDTETGLSYYGYRYYDPRTGRWPSRDPIEEDGGVNLYGFVGNTSINFCDALGLKVGEMYNTPKAAMNAAIDYALDSSETDLKKRQDEWDRSDPKSRNFKPIETFEYGGRICCSHKEKIQFYFTEAVTDGKNLEITRLKLSTATCNKEDEILDSTVGVYHNHPNNAGHTKATLSKPDKEISDIGFLLGLPREIPKGIKVGVEQRKLDYTQKIMITTYDYYP
jgi:RHS repeat-associated protein